MTLDPGLWAMLVVILVGALTLTAATVKVLHERGSRVSKLVAGFRVFYHDVPEWDDLEDCLRALAYVKPTLRAKAEVHVHDKLPTSLVVGAPGLPVSAGTVRDRKSVV